LLELPYLLMGISQWCGSSVKPGPPSNIQPLTVHNSSTTTKIQQDRLYITRPPPPPSLPGSVEEPQSLDKKECVPLDDRGGVPTEIQSKQTLPTHQPALLPLHAAVKLPPAEALIRLRLLFDSKADLSDVDADGKTALHIVAGKGNPDIATVLLEAGANPNATVPSDASVPLHLAAAKNHSIVAAILLKRKANPESQDTFGATPLHHAVNHAAGDVVSVLVRNRTNPNIVDMQRRTPLHYAVLQGKVKIVEYLLKAKADARIEDKGGETALNIAFRCRYDDLVLAMLPPTNRAGLSKSVLVATSSEKTWNGKDSKELNEKEFAICLLRDLPVA